MKTLPLNINMDAKETSQNSLVQTLALSVLYNLDISLLETLGLTAYSKYISTQIHGHEYYAASSVFRGVSAKHRTSN